jgi:hypothetical protein
MLSPKSFIRRSPPALLRRYLGGLDISLPGELQDSDREFAKKVMAIFDELPEEQREAIASTAERVSVMSDEKGNTALRNVAQSREAFDALESNVACSFSMLLDDAVGFSRAEGVRYLDERRYGKQWDGFCALRGVRVETDEATLARLRTAISAQLGGGPVHVEAFRRTRSSGADGATQSELVQINIYREGRPVSDLAFQEGLLTSVQRKPVLEASLAYEAESGVIEVVQKDRESRVDLAKLFSRELLQQEFDGERVPLRRYDLSSLIRERSFPVDPEDKIERVKVVELRLMPLGGDVGRVTVQHPGEAQTIWRWAASQFAERTPLRSGWMVTRAKLIVHFRPKPGTTRGKVLPVTITMPQGCDLKDRTVVERLVGEKYLRRWGLLEQTDVGG